VEQLLHDIGRAYEVRIQATGKEMHFLVLISFLVSWGFIRTSAHLIRAQVSWWPGNVETKGGTHIHHLVWGILLLLAAGYVGIALDPSAPWDVLVAILFGIGMGLTLDEFALWLNLEDVYWSSKGRQSIDAVILTFALLTATLLGLAFWIDLAEAGLVFLGVGGERLEADESRSVLVTFQVFGAVLAVVCFLKGKMFVAILGLFLPAVALIGAIRLAKPRSPLGRRYAGRKRERAAARFEEASVSGTSQPAGKVPAGQAPG
jgi:hypothetical protein